MRTGGGTLGLWKSLRKMGKDKEPFCSAVVVAAGHSTRMGDLDKITADLGGMPVICRTVAALDACPLIHEIVVVTRPDRTDEVRDLCAPYAKVAGVVAGGETRTDSVYLGMKAASRDADLIAIHDGARPFVSQEVLSRVISAAARCNAAAPAVPVKDTLKRAESGLVSETVDRKGLYAVQTPQVFEASLIRAAIHQARKDQVALTDDCMAVERLGMKVTLTEGDEANFKLTTPADLARGEAMLARTAETV